MRLGHAWKFSFAILAILLSSPNMFWSQDKDTSAASQALATTTYPNTAEGLRLFLQDLLTAAKNGDTEKTTAFLKATEIPNCEAWLHGMYASDRADSWMGLCDAKALATNEKSLQELLVRLGKQNGEVSTRKVNDNPQAGKGMEWGWLQAIKHPLDIYFAAWKTAGESEDSKSEPIGYFMFIDGGFRWESNFRFSWQFVKSTSSTGPPSRTRVGGAVQRTKLRHSVQPDYPEEAKKAGIEGTVRLHVILTKEGSVEQIQVVSGHPLLVKAALDAVRLWRYEPTLLNGEPVEVETEVDVVFHLQN